MPGATWKFAGTSRRPTPSIAMRDRQDGAVLL
jgi:hypothetical protein